MLTHFTNRSAHFINRNPIANYITENNLIKINHEYFFRYFICMGYNYIDTPTVIGDPIECEERAFKPYFSPMTGRPWQPTQLDYLLLRSSISKYTNFKI